MTAAPVPPAGLPPRAREVVDEARERAAAVLAGNGGAAGLWAAHQAYRQIWARDSMVGGLGLLASGDPALAAIHDRSLATLAAHQDRLGKIPHNVGVAGLADPALVEHGGALPGEPGAPVIDTAHAGCIDSNLWYILGHHARLAASGAEGPVREAWSSLERAHRWLEYQDSNGCGLLEAHEAMDWADLFANRYNTLFANTLWFAAHRAMARMARAIGRADDAARLGAAADDVRRKLDLLLWVGPEVERDMDWVAAHRAEWLYPLRRIDTELQTRPYYLPYVAFRDYGDRFDTFGNLLAIVVGMASRAQADRILDYIDEAGLAEPWPVRVVHPPVQPGERDWREYYRVRNLNLPDQYHNGGAWPLVGGFHVAALVAAGRLDRARATLERLAAMNRQGRAGEWEFNEWFHGRSGRPMGMARQSWSAAMYLYAHECVRRGACPFLGEELGR